MVMQFKGYSSPEDYNTASSVVLHQSQISPHISNCTTLLLPAYLRKAVSRNGNWYCAEQEHKTTVTVKTKTKTKLATQLLKADK